MEYWDARIAYIGSRVSDIPSAVRPTVLALHGSIPTSAGLPAGSYFAIGGTLLANDLIRCCGAVSPLRAEFATSPGEQLVSFEQIKDWDPDIIVVAGDDRTLIREAGWKTLKAVRTGRVHALPNLLYLWGVSSPEMILYFQWIANAIYPDRFRDLDFFHEAQFFYKSFFRYDMPDNELEVMLRATSCGVPSE
jgi:iron complex transport system substrate-binding protein